MSIQTLGVPTDSKWPQVLGVGYVLHACHGSNGLLNILKLQQLVVLELRGVSVADLSPMSELRCLQCLVGEDRKQENWVED